MSENPLPSAKKIETKTVVKPIQNNITKSTRQSDAIPETVVFYPKAPIETKNALQRLLTYIGLSSIVSRRALPGLDLKKVLKKPQFQEAEMEIVGITTKVQLGSMNPAVKLDPTYHSNPLRKYDFWDKNIYTITVLLPNGTTQPVSAAGISYASLKKGDRIKCQFVKEADGSLIVTRVSSSKN